MKKSVICVAGLLVSFAFGLSVDPKGATVDVTAYKTATKIAVPMTFKDTKFTFLKENGSATEVLNGATAIIDLNKIDTHKNPLRDSNIKNKFFKFLVNQNAEAKVVSVTGDDKMGELKANIKFNGVEKEVPMKYEVKGGKLTAMGEIDLMKDFNSADAFTKFATDIAVASLHGKKTWENVTIGFSVPVK